MLERLYLVGMMGAGKTTVGRLLAAELGWGFVDSDDQVCKRTGRTVREIFEADGEAAFRAEESAALRAAAVGPPAEPAVVSVAGGAVIEAANRQLINETGTVVWLNAPARVLAARVAAGKDHRPLLGADPETTLSRLEQERGALYREIADLTIDASDRSPTSLANEIARWYRDRKGK